MGKFMVTETDKVVIYDSYTFEKVGDPLPIKLFPTETREPMRSSVYNPLNVNNGSLLSQERILLRTSRNKIRFK